VLDDLHRLRDDARTALDHGRLDEAEAKLLLAAAETHVAESDYVSVLVPLAQILRQRGAPRAALTVLWYLASHDASYWNDCAALLESVPHVDRGRTLLAMGRGAEAAREMEDAGLVATAAIYREEALDWQGARALWARLGGSILAANAARGADAYNAALLQCNLARCAECCGDARQAHDAVVLAVRLLEEAADHFESTGLRERAFDCFQALIQVGREHASFEDVLEGFVNCIRILREDHLQEFALHYMDDAIALAIEKDELSAAATLALEASRYARAFSRAPSAAHYLARSAELWAMAAHRHVESGDPPEMAENALLAAVVGFSEVGQFRRVGELYDELRALDIPAANRARYAHAARRYEGVADDPLPRWAPARTRQDARFPDVWHVDLLEWEQAGSAVECCADVLLGASWPDVVKRKALVARLVALEIEGRPESGSPEHVGAKVRLADRLADVQLYVVLSPLERLWQSPHRAVRLAVLSALQRLSFKRTFVTVRAGLSDPDRGVADHAATTLESLDFPHAFDPLSRIVRESSSPRVRASAITALAKIDTREAAEFLMGILDHGSPKDREAAMKCLRERGAPASFGALAKEQLASSSRSLQPVLRELLERRA